MNKYDDSAPMNEFSFVGPVTSWSRDARGLTLKTLESVTRVMPIEEGIVRIRCVKGQELSPDEPSWALAPTQPQSPNFTLIETPEELKLSLEAIKVVIRFNPLRITALDSNGDLLCSDAEGMGMGFAGDQARCVKAARPLDAYYGFGEKTGPLNKRGMRMIMFNMEPLGYTPKADPIYQSHPFFIAYKPGAPACGIFFNNTYKSYFDMGAENPDWCWFGAAGGEINYYIIAGPGIKDVIKRYTLLVGRQPLPPIWSLGHHQSRWSYHTETEALSIARRFRKKSIPNDAVYLDINYMRGYRVFTWHPRNFPNPGRMIREIHDSGARVVCIIDPGVKVDPEYSVYREGVEKGYFIKNSDGSEYHGNVWPGTTAFPDFTREEVRNWWAELHRSLMGAGVDGIWNDMNEPAHQIPALNRNLFKNLSPDKVVFHDRGKNTGILKNRNIYGLLEAMATHAGMLSARPDSRPFILTRSGFSGIARYAAVWTGDNFSRWSHLAMSIPMIANLGLSGVALSGADIGGFVLNCTAELYARWIQLGAFYPYCRTHSMRWCRSQEPWSFGPRVESIAREYISLRYRLLPYFYTLFHQAGESGIPPFRPMVLEFPEEPALMDENTQAMIGDWILIAPILNSGQTDRDVFLPQGVWFDFHSGAVNEGPALISVQAPLEMMPIFIRGGCIIPQAQPGRNAFEPSEPDIQLHIYPDHSGAAHGELYEDDGLSYEYRQGNFALTRFEFGPAGAGKALNILERQGAFKPPKRNWKITIHNADKPESIKVSGEMVPDWSFDQGTRTLGFQVPDTGETVTVEIRNSVFEEMKKNF